MVTKSANGIENNMENFRRAFEAIEVIEGIVNLFVPAGHYLINNTLEIPVGLG